MGKKATTAAIQLVPIKTHITATSSFTFLNFLLNHQGETVIAHEEIHCVDRSNDISLKIQQEESKTGEKREMQITRVVHGYFPLA